MDTAASVARGYPARPRSLLTDPFQTTHTGTATDTWWSLWSMGSRFQVGAHTVQVHTWHWTGRTVVHVDDVEVHRERNVGWHGHIEVRAGTHAVAIVTRWYPLQPVRVWVDERPYLDDLFPQLVWLQLIGMGLVLPPSIAFGASIVYDLWRLAMLQGPL